MSAKKPPRKAAEAPRFKVGDIAELVYRRTNSRFPVPGMEVEIVGGLEMRDVVGPSGEYRERGYHIQAGCSELYSVLPDQLRRIPPKDPLQTVRWSECPWQPGKAARRTRRRKRVRQ